MLYKFRNNGSFSFRAFEKIQIIYMSPYTCNIMNGGYTMAQDHLAKYQPYDNYYTLNNAKRALANLVLVSFKRFIKLHNIDWHLAEG